MYVFVNFIERKRTALDINLEDNKTLFPACG